ncbi:MAG: GYF domain-containing protein, partial [Phycisphaerae bacterium]
KYQELSAQLREKAVARVDDEYGLDIPQLYIVNISLPEEVEKALDTRTQMGVIGDMGRFQQYQMGRAMTAAAENPAGGGASEGMGLGVGFAMASKMMGGAGSPMMPGASAAPPPPPVGVWHVASGGQASGPFTLAQLASGIAQGQLSRGTMVWTAGMASWLPAEQVPQLAAYFDAPPPPPPAPPANPGA